MRLTIALLVSVVISLVQASVNQAWGPPSPDSVDSSFHLLRQNDFNYTDAINHVSTIVLEPKTFDKALSACELLDEGLLDIHAATKLPVDLEAILSYLEYRHDYAAEQAFWMKSPNAREPQTLQLRNGRLVNNTLRGSLKTELPALCSQSAPFRTARSSDRNGPWRVSVRSGPKTFIGYRDQLSFRFLGIPYANPPRRWEYSTVYNNSHRSILNATNYGSSCWQTGAEAFSEDCLFLNVFTPYLPKTVFPPTVAKLRPVMFWIHGGALTSGSGNDPTFDGGNLVSRGDVVLVTINYRLSTLGFLSLNDGAVNGNYGLADQIVALEWVRQNIAAFGGDPNRITIFGQSAGAASVRALLSSPKGIGKFAAGISQSNPAGGGFTKTFSLYYTPSEEVAAVGAQIVDAVNCTQADDVVACLRVVPAEVLVNLPAVARFFVVDGQYLVTKQLELNGSGSAANVPTMWGTMKYDGAALIGYPTSNDTLISALQPIIGNQSVAAVASGLFPLPYGPNNTLNIFNVTARIATDIEFRCLDLATTVAAAKNKVFPSIFYYSFHRSYQLKEYDPNQPVCLAPRTPSHPFGDASLPYLQCHAGELYYVFGNLGQFSLPFRDDADVYFSQLVVDHWVAFAWQFNPNPPRAYLAARRYQNTLAEVGRSGVWEAVNDYNPSLRELNYPSVQGPFEDTEQCDFLGYPLNFYE